MSYRHSRVPFAGRDELIKQIRHRVETPEERSSVVVLHGELGVGKSAVGRELLASLRSAVLVSVRVERATQHDGELILLLARALQAQAAHHDLTGIQAHIAKRGTPVTARYSDQESLENFKATFPWAGFILQLREMRKGTGHYGDGVLAGVEIPHLEVLIDWIEAVLQQKPLAVRIENVHRADRHSLEQLFRLIGPRPGHLLVLELTNLETHPDAVRVHDVQELLRAGPVERYTVEPVPKPRFEDLQRVLDTRQMRLLAEKGYERPDLNLHGVFAPPPLPAELTADLPRLSPELRMVLCSLTAHHGVAELELLRRFERVLQRSHGIVLGMDVRASAPASRTYLFRSGSSLGIRDSAICEWLEDRDEFQEELQIAHDAWRRVYDDIDALPPRERPVDGEDLLMELLFFHLQDDPPPLDKIARILAARYAPGDPDRVLTRVADLHRAVQRRPRATLELVRQATLTIVNRYYGHGFYREAAEALEAVSGDSLQRFVYEMAIRNRLGDHERVVLEIRARLAASSPDQARTAKPSARAVRMELMLRLIEMNSLRALNRSDEWKRLFNDLSDDPELRTVPEYGFLLRNAEQELGYDESIRSLRSSIEHFRRLSSPEGEAESLISLAMCLGETGSNAEALAALDEAWQTLEARGTDRHVLLNDRAAILMHGERVEWKEVIALLEEATRTAVTVFDALAVRTNLCIALAASGRTGLLASLIREVEEWLGGVRDQSAQQIVYFNLHYVCGRAKRLDRSGGAAARYEQWQNEYWKKVGTLYAGARDHWGVRLGKRMLHQISPEYHHLARSDFEPLFITYWHFPIPTNL